MEWRYDVIVRILMPRVAGPLFFDFFEILFSYTAKWADPIRRDVLKCCSWGNPAVRVTGCRIIYVSADYTNIFFHNLLIFDTAGR